MRSDPLIDTLFRATTISPQLASAAPVRAAGTRSRAGNAMNRSRSALLDGARRAVETSGTKITMAQVAAAAGVAKATLYNHFRTREAVLNALLVDEIGALTGQLAGRPVAEALTEAATALSDNALLRTLGRVEPATLAALARIDLSAQGWQLAQDAVQALLGRAERAGTETVLRWLASHLVTPASAAAIAADVEVLLAGLPPSPAAVQQSVSA